MIKSIIPAGSVVFDVLRGMLQTIVISTAIEAPVSKM